VEVAIKRVTIIGAGVGGLATALRLAHRGCEVTVLEKTGAIGGRNRREELNGCSFDGGPTLLMMLDPFRKLFADVGECFEEHVPITLCDPSYRVFYADGTRIDATPNMAHMLREIDRVAGPDEAAKYPAFLGRIANLYYESIPHFVRTDYGRLTDVLTPAQLVRALRLGITGNLYAEVAKVFRDPRLQMLFTFQSMYLGLSPFRAPWVYATLAYMEYGEGIWYPQGGLPRISEAIAELAEAKGATIRLNSPVARIEGSTVILESGERIEGDAVVSNADLPYAARELAAEKPRRDLRYSCSAYLMYIDYEGDLPNLCHHNVMFGKDYRENLEALFDGRPMPDDPAFYVCVSSKTDPTTAPPGHSNVFVLVPCPNLERPFDEAAEARIRKGVFERLCHEADFDAAKIRGIKTRGPHEWQNELNLDRGAAFGISHELTQSAFMRPGVQSKHNPALYFVGASTMPGNGLPMVLISAEVLEARLVRQGVVA
jgi:phytoene desaturase